MKIYRYNRQEFEACLVKGYDWKTRCDRVGNAVEEILEQSPVNKRYRAGEMASTILRAYDIPGDRATPFHKAVASVITAIGKLAEYKKHITLGKEIRCGTKEDGSPRWARERLWRGEATEPITDKEYAEGLRTLAPADVEAIDVSPEPVDLPIEDFDLAPAEASAQAEHKSDKDTSRDAQMHAARLLIMCGWNEEGIMGLVPWLETAGVQGVDNKKFSKHPSPGAARVDCGECGGSGKVYMKQEPTT